MKVKPLKNLEKWVSDKIPHAHSRDVREQRELTRSQMELYKQQKEELHRASEEMAQQKKVEADKLHRKQIRALRSSLRRPGGFLESNTEVKDTLG